MPIPDDGIASPETLVATGEQLDQHAMTVSGLAERADLAHGAARQVGLDASTYGLICSFIPRHMAWMQERLVASMRLEAEMLAATAEALRSSSASFRTVDMMMGQQVEAIHPPPYRGDAGAL